MPTPALSEAVIREHADPNSYSRGMSYYARGAVGELVLRGGTLAAEVEGSEPAPYRVRLSFDAGGVTAASCTCPYDWGGWCKHIVAVALKCLREPGAVEARPPLDELLADLDRGQLVRLLAELAARDPDTGDEIERRALLVRMAAAPAAGQAAPAGAASARRSPIDQAAIRQQVRAAMRPARRGRYEYDYYDEEDPGGDAVEALRPLLEQAQRFTVGGDAPSALAALEALTGAYVEDGRALFDELEEVFGSVEGAALEFFGELSEAWAEAILSADLSEDEREEWGERIAGWQDAAADLGADDAFELALAAAEQGWDYPPLRAVLAGQIGELGAWAGDAPDYADDLALVRLRVLDRQGRHEEYLRLAQAEGQAGRYVAMLARLGRTAEALAEGLASLTSVDEVREVAGILRERGDLEGALRLAEHGLTLAPAPQPFAGYGSYGGHERAELASWAADLAAGMGQPARALAAAQAAFRAAPSLSGFLKARELAGDGWDTVRDGLLEGLRHSRDTGAKVDVFLHEQLIDDAIAAVTDGYDGGLLARVMEAAVATRPEWVVHAATAQAEQIMGSGKSQHYAAAVDWLRRARDAYHTAGREADWSGYLGGVRAQHGRKYKLMGLLDTMLKEKRT